MLMLTRRLQLLIDDDRHRRLEAEAAKRRVSVATLVRDAIDLAFPSTSDDRRAAGVAILAAPEMEVPDPDRLHAELDALRERHG